MSYRGAVLLGIVILKAITVVLTEEHNTMKPIGHKQCNRLCSQMTGCSSYVYVTSDLSCRFTYDTSVRKATKHGVYAYTVLKTKERKYADKMLRCPMKTVLFRSRSNNLRCKLRWNQNQMTRLLIHLFRASLIQLYMQNNSILPYPYINDIIHAIDYVPTSRTLVVASYKSNDVYTVPLDGGNKTILKKSIFARGIAVDGAQQLVFMISDLPCRGISVMTTRGENFTTVLCRHKWLQEIALDTKRSVIYIVRRYQYLGMASYQGKHHQRLGIGQVMQLKISEDVLYYMKRARGDCVLYKMSLTDHRHTLLSRPNVCGKFVVFANDFYILPSTVADKFFKVSEDGEKTRLRIRVGYKSNAIPVKVFAIP